MLRFSGKIFDVARSGCECRVSSQVTIEAERIKFVESCPAGTNLLMPPLANGHDHVRAIRPTALGGFDLPLELWLTHMTNIPKVDPYLTASVALGRQVLGGVGAIMIHYTRPVDRTRVLRELGVVARAAQAIGVRVGIAVALRDINPLGYGPDEKLLAGLAPPDRQLIREKLVSVPETPHDQVASVERLAEKIENSLVTVQFGPYGMEWCSRQLLKSIAASSALSGRRVHMHLLESRQQREYLDSVYPQGPVHFLDEIGMLSPRLSVAHAVWLRENEMELLAARGVTIAVNASSNLTLRSGVAPVTEFHRRGIPLALGMDGFSFDDDDDAFRELRLNYLLHRGAALEDGISPEDLFYMASYGGRRSVTGMEAGDGIAAGSPADLMDIDYSAITRDLLVDDMSKAHILARRATSRLVRRLVVAGREIACNGQLTGINLKEVEDELDLQARQGKSEFRSWTEVAGRLRERLKQFYAAGLHYCS